MEGEAEITIDGSGELEQIFQYE